MASPQMVSSTGVSYGYPHPEPDYAFELKCFRAGQEVLFFGTWEWRDSRTKGKWFLHLLVPADGQSR